jgi:phage replication-related protein YjqB (UPF0714/DUF867 family)
MKDGFVFVLLAWTMLGCGSENFSPTGPTGITEVAPPDPDADTRLGNGHDGPLQELPVKDSGTDYYRCFQAGYCTPPALSSSTLCLPDRDYTISVLEQDSDIVVLSFHGGLIEPNSTDLAADLAYTFGWSSYDLSAHGTTDCLAGRTDFERLHITATHFNDPVAVDLVSRHKKAVSIHGYDNNRSSGRGAICVGGANTAEVQQFIAYMKQRESLFTLYTLQPVDAAAGDSTAETDCSGLTGTASSNIINRAGGGAGGLQLEMTEGLKADLLTEGADYDELRHIFYGAIRSAMAL